MGKIQLINWMEEHPELPAPPDFQFRLLGRHNTSLERQLKEALLIENENPNTVMNKKGEWGINLVPRLALEDQGEPLSRKRQQEERDGDTEGRNPAQRNDDDKEKDNPFEEQYKQRKRRRKNLQGTQTETQSQSEIQRLSTQSLPGRNEGKNKDRLPNTVSLSGEERIPEEMNSHQTLVTRHQNDNIVVGSIQNRICDTQPNISSQSLSITNGKTT